jgi:hypothetical protein
MSQNNAAPDSDAGADHAALDALLLESLTALANAGQGDAACRLAGRACALYRQSDMAAWSKFNILLHRLSKTMARTA